MILKIKNDLLCVKYGQSNKYKEEKILSNFNKLTKLNEK